MHQTRKKKIKRKQKIKHVVPCDAFEIDEKLHKLSFFPKDLNTLISQFAEIRYLGKAITINIMQNDTTTHKKIKRIKIIKNDNLKTFKKRIQNKIPYTPDEFDLYLFNKNSYPLNSLQKILESNKDPYRPALEIIPRRKE